MAKTTDTEILEIAINKLSKAFDEFIDGCIDKDGYPKKPDMRSIMKARGYLPPACKLAFERKK